MEYKVCTRCGDTKISSEFARGRNHCKRCERERNKKWRDENKEKVRERIKKYCDDNKEYYKKYRAKAKYKEKMRDLNKKWRDENKEKVREYKKKYRAENKDRLRGYYNKWRKHKRRTDPDWRLKQNLRSSLCRAVKRGATKRNSALKYLGCPIEDFKVYLAKMFREDMTWENYGTLWEIDHILPVSRFDFTKEENIYICFHYTNLQPLYAEDNNSKKAKVLDAESALILNNQVYEQLHSVTGFRH